MKASSSSMSAPASAARPDWLRRCWAFVVDGLAALATCLIGILMVIICADIVFRNVFGASLPLVSEIGALLVVLIVALQLASAIRADRLPQVEVVMLVLSRHAPRAAAALKAAFALTGAAMMGMIAWATAGILAKDAASGDFIGTPGLGTLPTWPFRALIMIGMAVAALAFASAALRHLLDAVTGRIDTHEPG